LGLKPAQNFVHFLHAQVVNLAVQNVDPFVLVIAGKPHVWLCILPVLPVLLPSLPNAVTALRLRVKPLLLLLL
jgi:hypothetical protein